MTPESMFVRRLIAKIEQEYPGAIILKNDANSLQGFPDRLILWRNYWAAFEAKAHAEAYRQPNQPYYINLLNQMSYAKFVYPENEKEFLDGLQQTLRPGRATRLSIS